SARVARRLRATTCHSSPAFRPFPYTTLFRSKHMASCTCHVFCVTKRLRLERIVRPPPDSLPQDCRRPTRWTMPISRQIEELTTRSEEHTSELQSRENLVCRLLLEKKTSSPRIPRMDLLVVERVAQRQYIEHTQ